MAASPGRPSRWTIDIDALKERMETKNLTPAQLVRAALKRNAQAKPHFPISESTYRSVLREGRVSIGVIRLLYLEAGIDPRDYVTDKDFDPKPFKPIKSRSDRRRVLNQDRVVRTSEGRIIQDRKNLLSDPELSELILGGQTAPLHQILNRTVVFPAMSDEQKDVPFVPGMGFNHFIQLSLVVILNVPGADERYVLGYSRDGSRIPATYRNMAGLSFLWATGFEAHMSNTVDHLVDDWLRTATDDPIKAESQLLDGDSGILCDLFTHKLDFSNHKVRLEPFGIATNDQRGSGRQRVYTQLVFKATVHIPERPKDLTPIMKGLLASPDQPWQLDYDPDLTESFISTKRQPNNLDQVVWEALHGDKRRPRIRSALFALGLRIV